MKKVTFELKENTVKNKVKVYLVKINNKTVGYITNRYGDSSINPLIHDWRIFTLNDIQITSKYRSVFDVENIHSVLESIKKDPSQFEDGSFYYIEIKSSFGFTYVSSKINDYGLLTVNLNKRFMDVYGEEYAKVVQSKFEHIIENIENQSMHISGLVDHDQVISVKIKKI